MYVCCQNVEVMSEEHFSRPDSGGCVCVGLCVISGRIGLVPEINDKKTITHTYTHHVVFHVSMQTRMEKINLKLLWLSAPR